MTASGQNRTTSSAVACLLSPAADMPAGLTGTSSGVGSRRLPSARPMPPRATTPAAGDQLAAMRERCRAAWQAARQGDHLSAILCDRWWSETVLARPPFLVVSPYHMARAVCDVNYRRIATRDHGTHPSQRLAAPRPPLTLD